MVIVIVIAVVIGIHQEEQMIMKSKTKVRGVIAGYKNNLGRRSTNGSIDQARD